MKAHILSSGGEANASSNQLGGWMHPLTTVLAWREQMLTSRFCLPQWMAQFLFSGGLGR